MLFLGSRPMSAMSGHLHPAALQWSLRLQMIPVTACNNAPAIWDPRFIRIKSCGRCADDEDEEVGQDSLIPTNELRAGDVGLEGYSYHPGFALFPAIRVLDVPQGAKYDGEPLARLGLSPWSATTAVGSLGCLISQTSPCRIQLLMGHISQFGCVWGAVMASCIYSRLGKTNICRWIIAFVMKQATQVPVRWSISSVVYLCMHQLSIAPRVKTSDQ